MPASILALVTAATDAQEIEPRQYSNVPVGFNFLVVGAARSEGGALFDPSVPLINADVEVDNALIGYARSIRLGPYSGKIDAAIGRACLSGSAEFDGIRDSASICGTTDARIRVSVNFLGAPPLAPREFADYSPGLVFGASIGIGLPTGQYDSSRLVNVGSNRLAVKAELGASRTLPDWILETALAASWFETNSDFFGGRRRSQDEILSLQGHLVRNLSGGRWISFSASYYRGGRTTTGNAPNTNLQSNARFGITWSQPVSVRHSIKLNFSRGVRTRTGTDFDTFGAAWQYSWSGRAS